jgi:hypothetical protein
MRVTVPVRIGVGGILLPALLFLSLVACGNIEAKPADTGTAERAGEYEVSMDMEPNPPRTGQPADFTFTVLKAGEPVETSEVTPRLVLDMPKMPMGLPEVPLEATGSGQWRAKNVQFPMVGGWAATLALPSGDEEESVTFEFDVAP